ncbi:zinc finger protein 142-like [Watersipora subatra]|uniref:zinc finger protein 142-like n=1 Tax=Watersipora subatra TaxID=2589382 RepID=UPI00355B0814
MEVAVVEVEAEKLNPYAVEKLSPHHLELLFPAIFYKSDEDLSLHLSQSCLIETLAWDGDMAIGETAFWLKVLSTPQSEFLKQQKKLFKLAIAERCKDISNTYTSPAFGMAPEVITFDMKTQQLQREQPKPQPIPEKKPQPQLKPVIRVTTAENGTQVGVLTTVQERVDTTTNAVVTDQMITDNEWEMIEKHLNNGVSDPVTPQTSGEDLTSATPGFGIKTYKCRHCDFASDNRAGLNRHQKLNHADELPFSCDRCDYTSKYAWSIKTHIDSVHLKSKRFKCPLCDYATSQACFLKRHTLRRHNPEKGAYKCAYCDYSAHHPNSLQRHVNRQHTQNFAHKCPYCDYGRDCKYLVEDHINDQHLKKVVYQCSECSFNTYKQRALKSHHKTHENRSVMQCSECEYKSVSVSGLTKHMKQEHPDVDAKATVAGTKGKKSIANVVQRDGDEYTAVVMGKCKYCDYANENLIKLKAHVRRYHKRGAAQCPYCQFSASTKAYLSKHIANKHAALAKPSTAISTTVEALMPQPATSEDSVTSSMVVTEAIHMGGELMEQSTESIPTENIPSGALPPENLPTVTVDSGLTTVSIMEDESGSILVIQGTAE